MKIRKSMLLKLMATTLFTAFFTSCQDPIDGGEDEGEPLEKVGNGFYVMTEGTYGRNNSALDFYSLSQSKTHLDLFLTTNGAGLGETANDMIEANGKLFIVVNASNCVMVVDKTTCAKLAMIPINQGENPQPRCIAYDKGKLYVSCFDGYVYKIDASTYKIEKTAKTEGRNPEAIAVCDDKLFVANTGGLDFPNFDNSISVMNPDDLSLITKIEGLFNPGGIKVKGNKLIVQARGAFDYNTYSYKDSELVRIDASSLQIEERANIIANEFTLFDDNVLYIESDANMNNYYKTVPVNNLSQDAQILISPSADITLTSPYYIGADENYIYVTDAKDYVSNGECFVFDHQGELKYRFNTSTNPKKVIAVQ
jgi:DNA-binding beta-propeller fold protein YncE